MTKKYIDIKDIPQEFIQQMREQVEADPRVRQMRIKQNMMQRQGNVIEALKIGKAIENLHSLALQAYMEDAEKAYTDIDLGVADLPASDRDELLEIIVTLFLAADIIDTATHEFNDVLHRSGKDLDMTQFDDINELAVASKAKLEYFSTHSDFMKGLAFGDRSDNMYHLLRNKARSLIRKKNSKEAKE